MLTIMRRLNLATIRKFSTPAPASEITAEDVAASQIVAEKLLKFNQKPVSDSPLSRIVGNPKDIYEPANISELAALNGMPAEHANRTVIINQRPLKTLQSGQGFAHQWQISWKVRGRWINPLMGWTSSADPLSNLKLTFDSDTDAIAFAKRNNWKYEVLAPTSKRITPSGTYTYKDNFLDVKTQAFLKRDGMKTKIFASPGFGSSNFFMPLKYHGDGEVTQHGPTTK